MPYNNPIPDAQMLLSIMPMACSNQNMNTRFEKLESDLKQINTNLGIIIGKVDTMLRRSGHNPEEV